MVIFIARYRPRHSNRAQNENLKEHNGSKDKALLAFNGVQSPLVRKLTLRILLFIASVEF